MRLKYCPTFYAWLIFALLMLSGYALIQPAFEGFDENPHYSRILDASEDTKSQFSGKHDFRTDVLDYPGPTAYASGEPPFSREKTYDNFYLGAHDALTQVKNYRVGSHAAELSGKDNWQYQHPPLYYILAGKVNQIFSTGLMVADIMVLRLFSVLLTILALYYCSKGLCQLHSKLDIDELPVNAALGAFVLCFPMFYFEFARLGNDSLVFLCLSLVFYYSANAYQASRPQRNLLYMSIFLMCGLWTKAIVLPLLPMFAIYSLYSLWRASAQKLKLSIIRDFLWTYLLPVALGLSWYVFSYLKFNDIGLGSEARDLGQSMGLIQGLHNNFGVLKFLRGLFVPVASFVYAGSWSLVRAPFFVYFGLGLIYCVLTVRYIAYLTRLPASIQSWMPLGLAGSLYAGLAYHVLVSLALSGLGTSGGWYLYVLTPWALLAVCIALDRMPAFVTKLFLWLGLGISVYLTLANALVYAGYIVKADDKGMIFVGHTSINALFGVFSRLEFVSYPYVSAGFFLAATVLAAINLNNTK